MTRCAAGPAGTAPTGVVCGCDGTADRRRGAGPRSDGPNGVNGERLPSVGSPAGYQRSRFVSHRLPFAIALFAHLVLGLGGVGIASGQEESAGSPEISAARA